MFYFCVVLETTSTFEEELLLKTSKVEKEFTFLLRCHLAQQDDAKKDVLCVPNTTTAKSAKYYSRIFYSICMKGAPVQIGSKM